MTPDEILKMTEQENALALHLLNVDPSWEIERPLDVYGFFLFKRCVSGEKQEVLNDMLNAFEAYEIKPETKLSAVSLRADVSYLFQHGLNAGDVGFVFWITPLA